MKTQTEIMAEIAALDAQIRAAVSNRNKSESDYRADGNEKSAIKAISQEEKYEAAKAAIDRLLEQRYALMQLRDSTIPAL